MSTRKLIVLIVMGVLVSSAWGTTYYVAPPPLGNNSNPGTESQPFATIQKGIDKADADTVIVADGTYSGTGNISIRLRGKEIIVRSKNGPDNCTIDVDGGSQAFYIDDGRETRDSIIEGFTVTGGINGIYIRYEACPTVKDCIITGNNIGVLVGGTGTAGPRVANCIISGNAGTSGGGVVVWCMGDMEIENCIIADNTAESSIFPVMGAGICYYGSGETATLAITNCTITGNSCVGMLPIGGGVYLDGVATVSNCIVWGNDAIFGKQICIGNYTETTDVTINYCDVEGCEGGVKYYEGGSASLLDWGAGNIDANPKFAGPDDYHVLADSPCIDAGDPAGNYEGQLDIDGEPRVKGSEVDIGADEGPVTWYVATNGDDNDDGLTWGTAFATIQKGIDTAEDGDRVLVGEGTYNETIDFDAACMLSSTDPTDPDVVAATIIDAEGAGTPVSFSNLHSGAPTLSGFTVKNGAYCVYTGSWASPTISNCVIRSNQQNSCGVFCNTSGTATIANCTISYVNYGVRCYCSDALVRNNVIHSVSQGIEIYWAGPTVKNNLIRDCSYYGIHSYNGGDAVIRNNTIADNYYAKGIYHYYGTAPAISNCILWGNNDDLYACSATYSCIEDGDSGTGNISSDPCFVDPQNHDYHLAGSSPCVDAGDENGDYTGEVDIDNGVRVQAIVDMGADETDAVIEVNPGSLEVSLVEGNTETEALTIDNIGGSALEFAIWPSNPEALGMIGMAQSEGKRDVAEADVSASEIVLAYEFSELGIHSDGEYDHLSVDGLDSLVQTGAPIVPLRVARVLVPLGKKVVKAKVQVLEESILPGRYRIAPGEEPRLISEAGGGDGALDGDSAIYNSDKSWPGVYFKEASTQSKRGYHIYIARLYPVQYRPKSGRISYARKLQLRLELEDLGEDQKRPMRPTKTVESHLVRKVDNPSALATYPSSAKSQPGMEMLESGGGRDFVPGGEYEYVIITNEELLNAPGPWNFQRLQDSKIARGISATIVTTEWIYANYDGTRPSGGEDNQTRIHNFLTDVYNWYNGANDQYVLLGGGVAVIPDRKFYGYVDYNGGTEDEIPCDMYYGCVEPNACTFDEDADGIYGESVDGPGGGEIDLAAEIYVGRAAVETVEEVNNFVRKTLMYNSTIQDYLPLVSMIDEKSSLNPPQYDFMPLLERIRRGGTYDGYFTWGFENHECSDLFTFDTSVNLYEAAGDWSASDFIDLANSGVHIFNNLAHSSSSCMGKVCVSALSGLTNDEYFFIYSQGCNPGHFDGNDCFAEEVTAGEYGAFAAIMNSRLGWRAMMLGQAGDSTDFNRRFWDTVLNSDPEIRVLEMGRANQISKEDNFVPSETDITRWVYFELNLFGDPEQQFLLGQERDSAWVQASPSSGTVHRENPTEVDVEFSAKTLAAGTYEGQLKISSNDPVNPSVTVPVTMTVLQASPAILPYDNFQSVREGPEGSFEPACMTYTLTNNGTASIDWSASGTEGWVEIDPNGGTLSPEESVDVNICVHESAYNLQLGIYYDPVVFTNITQGRTHERCAILTIMRDDYFTEEFIDQDPLDIENQTITLTPGGWNGYRMCVELATQFPTDPAGGTAIDFGGIEDDYIWEQIDLEDDKEVSVYEVNYDTLYVSGSGAIVFDDSAALYPWGLEYHFDTPRISGLYSWLAPWDGGTVSYKQLSDRLAVTFEDVPEGDWDEPSYPPGAHDNSFQVEMFFDGTIRITHLNVALYWPTEGIPAYVGLSIGGGVPENYVESDLSECFPSDYSTYVDFQAYIANGHDPSCWCSCWPYQCDGDADGAATADPNNYRVSQDDLDLIVANWKKKIDNPTLNACADIDHKAQGILQYRVYTNELSIVIANWKKTDEELEANCPRDE